MGKFAIIQTGGKQYKVQEGKKIRVEKLEGVEGSPVAFQDVIFTADETVENISIVTPNI
jgi:large subunit ribosomal protein L21